MASEAIELLRSLAFTAFEGARRPGTMRAGRVRPSRDAFHDRLGVGVKWTGYGVNLATVGAEAVV